MPTCLCPWARYLVSIVSLTWAHQGGIGRGKYYNLSADEVCTWPVAPLGEAKWLWRFSWYRNNRQQRFVSSGKRRYTNADIIIIIIYIISPGCNPTPGRPECLAEVGSHLAHAVLSFKVSGGACYQQTQTHPSKLQHLWHDTRRGFISQIPGVFTLTRSWASTHTLTSLARKPTLPVRFSNVTSAIAAARLRKPRTKPTSGR